MWWVLAAAIIAATAVAAIVFIRRNPGPAPHDGPTLEREALLDVLHEHDIETRQRQTPAPDLLLPYIGEDDAILDAVRAEVEGRKAIVVLLDDRLVSAEATLGHMGSKLRVVAYDGVDSFEKRTDVGGEIRLQSGESTHHFTHIPLRQFEGFVRALSEKVSLPTGES